MEGRMENILLTNVYSQSHRTTFQGREYLVAPAILMVSGVLNGSKGPLLYPPDEVAKEAQRWNGMPIVVYHPQVNGEWVSGRDPMILEKSGIGFVANATAKEYRSSDGKRVVKLRAETWYDVERTKAVDMRVWKALESGTPIELSTGLFTDNTPVENDSAVYNGVAYNHVAHNYRPDHLAILPDMVGACSIKDGCGVLINSDGSKSKAVENAGQEVTTPPGGDNVNKEQLVNWITVNCDCWKEAGDKEALMGMSEVKLHKMKTAIEKSQREEAVANAARQGFRDDVLGVEVKFDEQKQSLTANSTKKTEVVQETKVETGKETTNNQETKPMTEEQWLANAPPSVRQIITNAKAVEQRERQKLIDQITANVSDEAAKAKLVKRLKDKDLEELQDYLLLRTPTNNQGHGQDNYVPPRYLGDPATPTNNDGFDENDVLLPPTINWAEEYNRRDRNSA